MSSSSFDVVVIGSGPGGEVGAIRAAQLGLKTAIVEKSPYLGGTCLNVGCIPTKALLQAAKMWEKIQHIEEQGFDVGKVSYDWKKIMDRKEKIIGQQRKGLQFLMKKNKIAVFTGTGSFKSQSEITVTDKEGKEQILRAKKILLATGSRVRFLPFAKENGKNILSSDSILSIDHIPKSLAIIGGGVVGVEFASLFGRMGSNVTIIEMASQILPMEDGEAVHELIRHLKKQNVTIETSSKLKAIKDNGKNCELSLEGKPPQKFDKVLLAIGREPVTDNLNLNRANIKITSEGFIDVNSHYCTSCPHIFAIGDIIKTPALAHTASAEAIHAVESMAGHTPPTINYLANPSAIYTWPEIASIGPSEEELKKQKTKYEVAKFPFAPMAKAKIEGATMGFIKLIYEPKYREILSVHIVGATATELISEFALGKVLETTVDEIGYTIHPHPTIAETIMETAHTATGGAIHL